MSKIFVQYIFKLYIYHGKNILYVIFGLSVKKNQENEQVHSIPCDFCEANTMKTDESMKTEYVKD